MATWFKINSYGQFVGPVALSVTEALDAFTKTYIPQNAGERLQSILTT